MDFLDGLREEPTPLAQHLLKLTRGAFGAEEQHLQPLRQLGHLVHQMWRQQVSQGWGQMPLAEDGGAFPDSGNRIGLTSHNLELNTLIREEVTVLVLLVRVRNQEGLEVVSKQLVLVRAWQCVQKGQNVHFLELWSLVPVGKDFRIRGNHTKPLRFRRFDLQAHFAHLNDLTCVQQSDSLHTGRAIRRVLTFEIRPDILVEELL